MKTFLLSNLIEYKFILHHFFKRWLRLLSTNTFKFCIIGTFYISWRCKIKNKLLNIYLKQFFIESDNWVFYPFIQYYKRTTYHNSIEAIKSTKLKPTQQVCEHKVKISQKMVFQVLVIKFFNYFRLVIKHPN